MTTPETTPRPDFYRYHNGQKAALPFEAADGEPVDILFALAVPEDCGEDHLKLLAHIAELFGEPGFLEQLHRIASE